MTQTRLLFAIGFFALVGGAYLLGLFDDAPSPPLPPQATTPAEEADYLSRLKASRLSIERGQQLNAAEKMYLDANRENADAIEATRNTPAGQQVERMTAAIRSKIAEQLAPIDAKIKEQEAKVARQR
jgi:hypothetical protein